MSRCYPFPPPGYILDESLIESIKRAKEEEVKRDRKHKKAHKRKDRGNDSKTQSHKRRRKDDVANNSKKAEDHCETEFLEKSCLTVELEFQTSPQISSDSTLHKQSQSHRHNDSETCTWIGLSGKELKTPEVKNQIQSSSQAAPKESVGHRAPRDALRVCQEKIRDPNFTSSRETTAKHSNKRKIGKEKSSLCTLGEDEKPSSSHQEITGQSEQLRCSKCTPSVPVQFLNLIENWVPNRVENKLATDFEDQELWLLMKFGAKRHNGLSNQNASKGSSSLSWPWPIARFLPEAGVHALPFTVPF